MTKKISFNKEEGQEFKHVLKERVNAYFQEKNISIKANAAMYFKTTFYLLTMGALYGLLLSHLIPALLVYPILGFFIAIGTMNISHDALHGAYFSGRFGNRVLGLLMDLFGASSFYWRKEHTVDHHTFTNIAEHDADLMVPNVLRLCPKTKHHWFHRFQFIYAPFLYCVNLIHWVYYSDIKRIFALVKEEKRPPKREMCFLILFKFVHITTFLIIPLFVLPIAWWIVLLGYLCFLFTIGITLTIIFQ
ncbi:MAG: fatty acid desaturase family protein, partial [Chlamydiales bacterium]